MAAFGMGYQGVRAVKEGNADGYWEGVAESAVMGAALGSLSKLYKLKGWELNPNLPLTAQKVKFGTQTLVEGAALTGISIGHSTLAFGPGEWTAQEVVQSLFLAGLMKAGGHSAERFRVVRDSRTGGVSLRSEEGPYDRPRTAEESARAFSESYAAGRVPSRLLEREIVALKPGEEFPLFEGVPKIVKSKNGTFVLTEESGTSTTGLTLQELNGRLDSLYPIGSDGLFNLISKANAKELRAKLAKVEGKDVPETELRIIGKDGAPAIEKRKAGGGYETVSVDSLTVAEKEALSRFVLDAKGYNALVGKTKELLGQVTVEEFIPPKFLKRWGAKGQEYLSSRMKSAGKLAADTTTGVAKSVW